MTNLPIIKVVGVSAAGKSTLTKVLREAGYDARPVSQEHSQVADLWQRFERAHVLIYLDADLATQRQRRPDVTWNETDLAQERSRLAHANQHADLHINTATMSAESVHKVALALLDHAQVRRAAGPLPPLSATGSALPSARPAADDALE